MRGQLNQQTVRAFIPKAVLVNCGGGFDNHISFFEILDSFAARFTVVPSHNETDTPPEMCVLWEVRKGLLMIERDRKITGRELTG